MWTEITLPDYERRGGRYASDMTDREWALIAPFMPPRKMTGRPRTTDMRDVVDALRARRNLHRVESRRAGPERPVRRTARHVWRRRRERIARLRLHGLTRPADLPPRHSKR